MCAQDTVIGELAEMAVENAERAAAAAAPSPEPRRSSPGGMLAAVPTGVQLEVTRKELSTVLTELALAEQKLELRRRELRSVGNARTAGNNKDAAASPAPAAADAAAAHSPPAEAAPDAKGASGAAKGEADVIRSLADGQAVHDAPTGAKESASGKKKSSKKR